MKIILTLSIVLLSVFSFAQGGPPSSYGGKNTNASQHIGKISGYLIDAKTGDNLAFANIRLFRKNDILMEGTITDESGYFAFEELGLANYYLLVNYIGYEEMKMPVELNKNKTFAYFKKVKVNPGAINLEEVSIVEDKPIYESKMEKIVYNAENDLNESLDDATDVLRKTPLLSVDMDGNVSLRGSSNVKFLVNGKESTFFTNSASDALQMIPADQVKSVEVITSPTAKYEGEGSSGIINIITKQKNISGFKSTVRGSFGTRVNRQTADINYGNGKFGFSARGSARYGWPLGGQSTSYTEDLNPNSLTTRFLNAQTKGQWIGFSGSSEVYYDFNPYNSIVSSVSMRGRRQTNERWTSDSLYDGTIGQELIDLYAFTVSDTNEYSNTTNLRYGYEWTTDYVRKFSDHEDRELRLAFQLGGDVSDEDNKIYNNSLYSDTLIDKNDGTPLSYTFQLDYVHPFMDKHTIELGSKYVNRNMLNQYSTFDGDSYIQPYEQFDYQQDIFALYLSSKWELTKEYGLIVGLRAENTKISGQWNSQLVGAWTTIVTDTTKVSFNDKEYTTFLPNIIVSKKIDMTKSIKASYSKRISRPGMRYINPNKSYAESSSQTIGNPDLNPALTHQLELGYNSFARKYKGSYYLFFKSTTDLIEGIQSVETGGDKIIEYKNLGENNSVGFNYYGSISLGENLNFRGGFNLFTFQTTKEDLGIVLYNWNMGGSYDIGKGYKAETFGFFRAPNQTSQGVNPGFSMFSIGFKKEFKNKKGSIGLRFVEPFKQYKSFITELEEPGKFNTYGQNDVVFRSIGISFKYTFGELNFNAIKDRTNIKNDDLMQQSGEEY